MRAPNLDQMRSFSTLLGAGTFSAAARRLNLTQPAVSRQIRELEKRFGVRLVERAGRRVRPTRAGEQLLAQMQRIEAAVSDAMAMMAPYQDDAVGRVVVGTGATACIYLLPAILGAMRRRFPALQILVHTGNTPDIVRLIDDNVIDVGLVTAPIHGRSLSVTPGLDDEQVAVFPRSGMNVPKTVTPAALAALPLLLYEPGGNTRRVVDDWFRRGGVDARPIMELGSVEAIKELINAGLGCGILPRLSVAKDSRRFVVRSLAPVLKRKLVIVMRRDKVLSSGLRHMLKALKSVSSN
ncbi:MAG: LysR family transcriptional regulator [Pseudolabrys sp.]